MIFAICMICMVVGCSSHSQLERHAWAAHRMGELVNRATAVTEALYQEQQKDAIRKACGDAVFVDDELAISEGTPLCREEAAMLVADVRLKWSRIWHLQELIRAYHDKWRESIQLAAALPEKDRNSFVRWAALASDAIAVYDELVESLKRLGVKIAEAPEEITRVTGDL